MNLDAKKVVNAFQEIKLVIGELIAEMDLMNLDAHIGKLGISFNLESSSNFQACFINEPDIIISKSVIID